MASFTRAVLKLILIFLAFTRSPPPPLNRNTTAPPLSIPLLLLLIDRESIESRRNLSGFRRNRSRWNERRPTTRGKDSLQASLYLSNEVDESWRKKRKGTGAGSKGAEEWGNAFLGAAAFSLARLPCLGQTRPWYGSEKRLPTYANGKRRGRAWLLDPIKLGWLPEG